MRWPDLHWRPRPATLADHWRAVEEYVDIGRRYAQVIAAEATLTDWAVPLRRTWTAGYDVAVGWDSHI